MNIRKHSDLRALSLAYYWGWIARKKYLTLRHTYLQAITEGREPQPFKQKELAPPKKKITRTDSDSGDSTSGKNPIIIAGIILVLLAIIGFYFIQSDSGDDALQQQPVTKQHPSTQDIQTQAISPESQFINFLNTTFIQQNNWNPDNLSRLKFKWQGLSQEQQTIVRENKVFDEFSNILVGKIMGERNQDNIVPSDTELTLMTAARHMGLLELLPSEQ